ncbi:MAG: amino acid ABC transporter permease [Clostridia bacterium]|nr:amino acid ABC transporter permease [Clostridia bacterium]
MTKVSVFARGTLVTLELTLLSMLLGTVLGMLIALGRISRNKILKTVTWVYVWIFRGTPLLLQILIVYLAIPLMYMDFTGMPLRIDPFMAAIFALMLNTAAYLAEIFRAGILSIDKGQLEASKALGMSYTQAMTKVIIPQSVSRVIPPYSNEFIMILKDTSLTSVIGITELYREASRLASGTGDWRMVFIAAGVYLFLTTISTFVFSKVEKRTSRYL